MASPTVQRFSLLIFLAALLASFAVVASPGAVPQPVAAFSCWSEQPANPVRVLGPAVQGRGTVRCTDSVWGLDVRIRIYAKDCGTCPQYLFANSGMLRQPNAASNTRTHKSWCNGFRYYFVHVDGQFTLDGVSHVFISGKSSAWTAIQC